ncbi:arginase family protein [uncultured Clostridium sp.]|uniref:arginase family protein n=1 Tax=uncultured Clostridium sp. TaxID=59620 RepID=UPI0025D8E0D2|nr:arginase family protein [uncultured Clostridium sp.]
MDFQRENAYLTIMNFSNIYKDEKFYKGENINWIDCSDINGTSCYCDEYAEKSIKAKIENLKPYGLHFIDSGNYHYVSKFWIEKIERDFNLIVFDHHSDMQQPMFGNILSCGSWIMDSLESNIHLKKVILVGVGDEEKKFINKKYEDRIICVDRENFNILDCEVKKYPIYISIDKDVLSEKVINTNWNQGDMNVIELEDILHKIIKNEEVIGIDICGECSNELGKFMDIKKNDNINSELLHFFEDEAEELVSATI